MIEFGRMNEESMKYKDANQEDIPNVLESNPNVLRDPVVAKTKGMHTNRTNNIESSKTQQRGCGICGVLGHNRRTCDLGEKNATDGVNHGSVERRRVGEGETQREEDMVNSNTYGRQQSRVQPSAPTCIAPTSYDLCRPPMQRYSMSRESYPNIGPTDVIYQQTGSFQTLLQQMSPSIGVPAVHLQWKQGEKVHLAPIPPFFSFSQGNTSGPLLSTPPDVQRPHSQPNPK